MPRRDDSTDQLRLKTVSEVMCVMQKQCVLHGTAFPELCDSMVVAETRFLHRPNGPTDSREGKDAGSTIELGCFQTISSSAARARTPKKRCKRTTFAIPTIFPSEDKDKCTNFERCVANVAGSTIRWRKF